MKIKKVFSLILSVCFMCLFLSACTQKIDKYGAYISELRTNVYTAKSDNFKVSAITGKRENPYNLDGNCSGTQEFTVLTIEPAQYIASKRYTYKAVVNGVEYSGELKPHPFGKSFSADILKKCETDSITCVISTSDSTENFNLLSVKTPDMIDEAKALDIACAKLKKQIDSIEANGQLNAEIYIRLMENPIDNNGGYYWYVAFIGKAQLIYAALIHPVTMEVLAVRD